MHRPLGMRANAGTLLATNNLLTALEASFYNRIALAIPGGPLGKGERILVHPTALGTESVLIFQPEKETTVHGPCIQ